MKKYLLTDLDTNKCLTLTKEELQEITIALMGRSNILAEARGEKEADAEYAQIQPLIEKVLGILNK